VEIVEVAEASLYYTVRDDAEVNPEHKHTHTHTHTHTLLIAFPVRAARGAVAGREIGPR
jgi:hypothetical protein